MSFAWSVTPKQNEREWSLKSEYLLMTDNGRPIHSPRIYTGSAPVATHWIIFQRKEVICDCETINHRSECGVRRRSRRMLNWRIWACCCFCTIGHSTPRNMWSTYLVRKLPDDVCFQPLKLIFANSFQIWLWALNQDRGCMSEPKSAHRLHHLVLVAVSWLHQ